jgi:hypothetical protein
MQKGGTMPPHPYLFDAYRSVVLAALGRCLARFLHPLTDDFGHADDLDYLLRETHGPLKVVEVKQLVTPYRTASCGGFVLSPRRA